MILGLDHGASVIVKGTHNSMSAPASNPHTQGKGGGGGRKGRRKEEKKADRKEGVYIPMTAFLDYYA